MYIPPALPFHPVNLISIIIIILQISISIGAGINPIPKRPNLYVWLAQNSYICDPTLLNKRSHRFLAPRESVKLRCSCGDPLVTKAACGRRNGSRDKPKCFRLPDPCIQEYSIIFSNGGNRLTNHEPVINHRFLHRTTIKPRKKKPTSTVVRKTVAVAKKRPHRQPKIVSTVPVSTILRVRKLKKKSN